MSIYCPQPQAEIQIEVCTNASVPMHCSTPQQGHLDLQVVDASILKQYIFQKGFITEGAKARREAEAQNATLQVCVAVLHAAGPLLLSQARCGHC